MTEGISYRPEFFCYEINLAGLALGLIHVVGANDNVPPIVGNHRATLGWKLFPLL